MTSNPTLPIRLLARLLPVVLLLALTACSTTRALPDDEQLYTGIKEITFTDDPHTLLKKSNADTTGVITAVADAVTTISDVLEGKTQLTEADLDNSRHTTLTKEERKQQKLQQARAEQDFAAAKEEVEAVLAYPPNNAIFGSSSMSWPWQIGLWIHNSCSGSGGKMKKWLLKHFGTTPVLISSVSPEMRTKVATNTLHNYGYFRGKVGYEVLPHARNKKKAKVAYHVQPGPLYRLDSVAYLGYPARMDSILRANQSRRLLRSGDAFSVVNLSGEQSRIETLLKENGYYFFKPAYTTFRADTLMRPQQVQLQVMPAAARPETADHPWYIGQTFITIRRNEADVPDQTRTRRAYTYRYSGRKMPLRAGMWRHAIAHRRGETYKLSDQRTTVEKIGAMGVLSQMDIAYVPRDTTPDCDSLDIVISAVMDKLYDSTFEMNATLKSNQQVGPGVSYELSKRNAFRGGEKVSFKLFGSYEWQTGSGAKGGNSLLNSYELGTSLTFEFPRIVFPGFSRRRVRFPATTAFAIDADWKNRSNFFQMVSIGVSATYDWHKRQNYNHSLTLFSLDFDKLLSTTATFDQIMDRNQALYISMRDQFVPSLAYTFTYQSPKSRRHKQWMQFSLKEAAALTSTIYALSGEKYSKPNKQLFQNPFAQFVKATAEYRRTMRLSRSLSVATRAFAGIIYSYGNSLSAPYSEQFYVGGANSIRAFTVRSIGPGSYRPAGGKYAYMDQTGDVRLEVNAELRARLMGDLHGAVFLDAGNVWLLRNDPARPGGQLTASTLSRIAVGTGAGIRYDLDFLVIRLDVGIGLHTPYTTSKSGFYNLEKFKDGLGIHFAIGYPF